MTELCDQKHFLSITPLDIHQDFTFLPFCYDKQ